jgi:hypothetical protein
MLSSIAGIAAACSLSIIGFVLLLLNFLLSSGFARVGSPSSEKKGEALRPRPLALPIPPPSQ